MCSKAERKREREEIVGSIESVTYGGLDRAGFCRLCLRLEMSNQLYYTLFVGVYQAYNP